MKTLFTTYTHGNEIPPFVLPGDTIVCNEYAMGENTRYIDVDLNRVFGVDGDGYEHRRAKEILEICKDYELIVDIHTTTTLAEPTAIISNIDNAMYARIFKPAKIVIIDMPHTLIANVPHGVVMEYPRDWSIPYQASYLPPVYTMVDFVEAEPSWKEMEAIHRDGKTLYPYLVGEKAYDGKCFLLEKL